MFGWLARLASRSGGPRPERPGGAGPEPSPPAAERPVPAAARLIVGLGNPGPDYADTRHNAGFMVLDRLAAALGVPFAHEAAASVVAEGAWRGTPLALAKPQAFMNRSGPAVAALLRRYALEPSAMLVVYDDLALPLGRLRLRGQGGAGGHNGVQSVIEALGSTEFPRLRVGVGDSFSPGEQVAYVLAPFAEAEREAADALLDRAAEAALAFVHDGLEAAMSEHNRR